MADEISEEKALKTIVKGSGIAFLGMVISQITIYLLRLILARVLTPSEYGILFLGISLINIGMTIALLGIQYGVERYFPYYLAKNERKKAKDIVISAAKIVFPFSFFVFLAFLIFADNFAYFFNEPNLGMVIRILSFSIFFYCAFKIFGTIYLALKKVKYDLYSWHLGRSLVTLISVVAFSMLGLGLYGVTFGYTLGYAFAFLSAFVFSQKVFPLFKGEKVKPSFYKTLIVFSFPILILGILLDTIVRIDTLLIGVLKTSADVGIYQTSVPTAQFLWSIPSVLGVIFVPVMSELLSKNKKDEMKRIYKTTIKWGFYINFPILLLFVMYPNAVINTLFGGEYLKAGESLRFLSIGYMIYFIGFITSLMLNVLEKTKYHILNAGSSLFLGFILNYWLIQIYGITGAAIAMMFTLSFYTVLVCLEVYSFFKAQPFHKDMIKSFLSGLLSISIVYLITKIFIESLNIFILLPMFIVFFGLYFFLLLILKGFDKEDFMILKAVETKTGLKINILRKIIKKFL